VTETLEHEVMAFTGRMVRAALPWAALFAAAFLARTALDWFVPTTEFHTRSSVSTLIGVSIVLVAGVYAAWRDGQVLSGTAMGVATTLLAAIISIVGAALLYAVWHDEPTQAAIRGSGGLAEVFVLPVMLVIPGVVLGTVGGALGALLQHWARPGRLAS
jgi:hypothetical protein